MMPRNQGKNADHAAGSDGANPLRCHVTVSRSIFVALVLLCLLSIIPSFLMWSMLDQLRNQRNKEQQFWVLCHPGFTNQQRRDAFAELLWQGNREWRSARLARLDLTGIQLAGASIQQAHMEGCNLSDADLAEALLQQTQFDQADLSGTDLSRANLFECDLLKSDLSGATLIGVDLRGADIGQSNAADAKFVSANMMAARLELTVLTNADLRLANLVEADLSLADLTSANLFRADLTDANLHQANLTNANWWRALGLTADKIAELDRLYPPSEDADENLRQDYQRWREEQDSPPAADRAPSNAS